MRHFVRTPLLGAVALVLSVSPAAAQFVGTFSWQSAPFCNVVTLNVTQAGNAYIVQGYDSQCGAERPAPVTGAATLNPDGTVGLGLAIVNTPGGEPTHMDVAVNLATLGGPWSDSAGNSGTFVFNGTGGGDSRPTGRIVTTKFGSTSSLIGRRVNGTPTARAPITDGNNLLLIGGDGYDGSGFGVMPARIVLVASESWQSNAHGALIQFMTTENGGAGAVVRMTIDHDGRVGIGTTNPAEMLDVFGDVRVGTGNLGCVMDHNGTVIAGTCASDARFKRDVVSFEPMLSKVAALRPVHFYWRADELRGRAFGSRQSYGLMAQEVEEILPELVITDAAGYKAVNYSKLPLIALQAIKELKAKNDVLEAQNAAREAQNAALEAQNAEFERRLAALEARIKP